MSSIIAGTSAGTALVQTGDTTGALVIKTGGSATTAATFNADQTTTFVGAVSAPSFSGTSSTATNLAGGSNGTIPYQSAAGTTQMLAVGTPGQLLQTNGAGAPSWTTPSAGAVSLVSVVNASGASNVSFTDLSTTPAYYFIEFDGVYGSAGGTFEFYVSANNGGVYITANYRYTFLYFQASSPTSVNASGTTTGTRIILGDNAVSTSASFPTKGIVSILGLDAPRPAIHYQVTITSASSNIGHSIGSGMPDTTSTINAIKFQFGSGTITGNFRLYSVSKT